jgi:hypothetical protein
MPRFVQLFIGMLMLGSFAIAQTSNTQTNMSKSKEHTLQGCVQQSGDDFMLQTGKRKDIELISNEDLKAHIGHTVKVTGIWDRSADRSEASGKGHEGHETAAAKAGEHHEMKERHFRVSKVEMVSDSCTATTPKSK